MAYVLIFWSFLFTSQKTAINLETKILTQEVERKKIGELTFPNQTIVKCGW